MVAGMAQTVLADALGASLAQDGASYVRPQYPNIPLFFVDVNSVPYDLVKDYRIAKMPTVTILRKGEIARTYLW